ncbi:hypothetical protein Tco_0709642, partial [Tanacetum coccineum]
PSIAVLDSEGSGGNHGAQAKEIQALKAQGRKSVKSFKGEPSVHKDPAFDDLDDFVDVDDTLDYMESEDAQDEGRTSSVVLEEKESANEGVSTEAPVSTDKKNNGTDKQDGAPTSTSTPTPTVFGDDKTIAQVLIIMSQNKEKLKEKEKLANDEEVARKVQEEWEAKEEKKSLDEEEATKAALSNEYDFIQARLNVDKILAEKLQEEERERDVYY